MRGHFIIIIQLVFYVFVAEIELMFELMFASSLSVSVLLTISVAV